jgi:hypothetical protein
MGVEYVLKSLDFSLFLKVDWDEDMPKKLKFDIMKTLKNKFLILNSK